LISSSRNSIVSWCEDRLTMAFIEYIRSLVEDTENEFFKNSKYVLRVLKNFVLVSSTGLRKYTLYQYYNNCLLVC